MMVGIALEEAALLVAVYGVVGGVEVEGQVRRTRGVGGEELIEESRGDADQRPARFSRPQSVGGEVRGDSGSGNRPAATFKAGSPRNP
jgi:hypothetical protein